MQPFHHFNATFKLVDHIWAYHREMLSRKHFFGGYTVCGQASSLIPGTVVKIMSMIDHCGTMIHHG